MKLRVAFFLLVTLAASLLHFLVVLHLTGMVVFGAPPSLPLLVPMLWVLAAPMNLLLSSSFGHALPLTVQQVLFTANSLLWGFAAGVIIFWVRLRREKLYDF